MTDAFDASTRARVSLRGADVRAFLHRLTTNHVKDLQRGEGRLNALLTDKGRLVDVVHHLDRGDEGVLLVGSPGRGPVICAWLDRYLFSEKVEVVDLSQQGSAREVVGETALAPWAFTEVNGVIQVRTFDRIWNGARAMTTLVIDGSSAAPALDACVAASRWEAARVASGLPGDGEITEKFTPLDLGLHDAIHWAKGCYIGQEVIARLDTYAKQSKRLVVVSRAAPAGAAVLSHGAPVGVVTSSADLASLAVVKLPEDGVVQVKVGDELIEAAAHKPPVTQAPHD